jgi:hypothetical protein
VSSVGQRELLSSQPVVLGSHHNAGSPHSVTLVWGHPAAQRGLFANAVDGLSTKPTGRLTHRPANKSLLTIRHGRSENSPEVIRVIPARLLPHPAEASGQKSPTTAQEGPRYQDQTASAPQNECYEQS